MELSAREGAMHTEVITSLDGLQAIGAEWNPLLKASRADSLFLTWEWVSTWCRVYASQDLYVILVRDDTGCLVGVAPLRLVTREALGAMKWQAAVFVGHGEDVTPEYLDIIVRTGWEGAVVPHVVDVLQSNPDILEIDLQPIAAQSLSVPAILAALKGGGGITQHAEVSRCPIAVLPRSRHEFMAARSKNYRKKIGEYERRCQRNLTPCLRRSITPDDVHRDLESLRVLHLARWGTETRAFQSDEYLTFHARFAQLMLAQSRLRLFTLESEKRPIAVSYCFIYQGRYYFYQAGRDPSLIAERAGLVLMHKVLQEAIDEGAATFDFLSGREPYKYRWATSEDRSDRIAHWKNKAVFMGSLGQRVLSALRTIPERSGMRSKVGG